MERSNYAMYVKIEYCVRTLIHASRFVFGKLPTHVGIMKPAGLQGYIQYQPSPITCASEN